MVCCSVEASPQEYFSKLQDGTIKPDGTAPARLVRPYFVGDVKTATDDDGKALPAGKCDRYSVVSVLRLW